MKLEKPSPETHPIGSEVEVKTIDNLIFKGVIEAYTSDALMLKTNDTEVRLHPHEIYYCVKV